MNTFECEYCGSEYTEACICKGCGATVDAPSGPGPRGPCGTAGDVGWMGATGAAEPWGATGPAAQDDWWPGSEPVGGAIVGELPSRDDDDIDSDYIKLVGVRNDITPYVVIPLAIMLICIVLILGFAIMGAG